MDNSSVIIIGAGVAGLAAGCYAQMNGYRTVIYEMHDKPGGLCTSWTRRGYTFDASTAGLAGTIPGTFPFALWQELGVIEGVPLYYPAEFGRVVGANGETFVVYTDMDRLEEHLASLSPADAHLTTAFARDVRRLRALQLPFDPPSGLAGLASGLRLAWDTLPLAPLLMRYGRQTVGGFASRLRDPYLARAFQSIVHFGGLDQPLLAIMLPLAYADQHAAGVPLGGWLAFSRAIERRYQALGGQVRYRERVERILFEGNRAVGIRLAGGEEQRAGVVISAADAHETVFRLLEGRYADAQLRARFDPARLSEQPLQVNLGVARDMAHEPGAVTYVLETPMVAGGRTHDRLTVHNHSYDPASAPPGKAALTTFWDSDYGYWQELAADSGRYRSAKEQVADLVVAELERHYPGLAGQVETCDVSTPLTRERYTANWHGAMQGWRADQRLLATLFGQGLGYTLPGLEGFLMAGQWVERWGGITTAAQSGRNVARLLAKRDGKRFASRV